MTLTITPERFAEALDKAVAERGADHIYEPTYTTAETGSISPCVYVDNEGTPSCLIGCALANLGVDLVEHIHQASRNTLRASIVLNQLAAAGVIAFEGDRRVVEGVLVAADRAQEAQDHGHEWGDARSQFRQRVRDAQVLAGVPVTVQA